MFHGWMFDPDGDQAAADSTRSSTSFGTCRSVNPRTARRLVTASYTSMFAHLLLRCISSRGRPIAPPHDQSKCGQVSATTWFSGQRVRSMGDLCTYPSVGGCGLRLLPVSGEAIRLNRCGRGAL